MKIGFVINDFETEHPRYTTTRIAQSAREMGHEAWTIPVGNFAADSGDQVWAQARMSKAKKHKDGEAYLKDLLGDKAHNERIKVSDLDILMLRNDPADDAERVWAQGAGILFGELAVRHGVIVLNDPDTLSGALNKMYFQHFPPEVRPRTIITREKEEIQKFIKDEGGRAILKPLQGSGGSGVFLVQPEEKANINQMIEAITRDGYVIAQEYLEAAKDGDTRLFVVNGEPLKVDGHYAAFRRVSKSGDARSNLSSGGSIAKAKIDDEILHLAEIVRPKLVADGMFMVGLDIVGSKLMEINVLSPGGLGSAENLEDGTNFSHNIVEKLEKKVRYRDHSQNDNYRRGTIDNKTLATL
ncbi:MAG: glutathione synthetase [Pyrinomonadaceae bacterium]